MFRKLTQWSLRLCVLTVLSCLYISPLSAHHSAALFYDSEERITLTGTVYSFNFRNPHAIVILMVEGEDGEMERWTCETSAPSALRRRGWSQKSITPGEIITLNGIRSKDGTLLMRITGGTKEDGSVIGVSNRLDD